MQRNWVDRCTHTNMKKFTFNENFSIFIFASSNICTTVCSINSILWTNFLIKLFFSMPDFFIFTNMCNYRSAMEWSIWDFFVWILHSMKSVVLKCDGRVKLRNYANLTWICCCHFSLLHTWLWNVLWIYCKQINFHDSLLCRLKLTFF